VIAPDEHHQLDELLVRPLGPQLLPQPLGHLGGVVQLLRLVDKLALARREGARLGIGRGFFQPRVPGGQLGNGAMGNARWIGVRLKDVLNKAGVAEGARQVTFNGLDKPLIAQTPDLIKALDMDHALDGEVLLAYEMNGEELPWLNGYPLRLVVPGYYGTGTATNTPRSTSGLRFRGL